MTVSTLRDHSIAVAEPRMAGSAINIEALAPAIQIRLRDRERHVIAGIVAHLAGIEISVFVELAAGDGPRYRLTGRAEIRIKITFGERLEARLVVHVLTTARQKEGREYSDGQSHPTKTTWGGESTL